ncbi:MAG: hypothetical protein ACJAV2_004240 [Myxococcota bacterium]|jgi:hypothetical protein
MLILLTLMACSGDDAITGETDNANGDFGLVALVPANDALDVPLDTAIVAQFDKELRLGDIGVIGRRSVSGIDGDTLTAELADPLDLLTTYTVQTLGITSVDGDAFGDIQTTFTSRDGVWQSADAVTGQADLISHDSAVFADSTLLLTAHADRTEVRRFAGGIVSQPVTLDDGSAPDDTWLVANHHEATAVWTQDGAIRVSSGTAEGTWSAALPLSDSPVTPQTPTGLALTDSGTVAVAWRSSNARPQVATRVDGEWSVPFDIGCRSQSECSDVHLYADHTGDISVFIRGQTAGEQHFETRGFRNGEWTPAEVFFAVDGDIGELVVRTQTDETLAIWTVTNSEDAGLFLSRLQGDGSWSEAAHVRDTPTISALDLAPLPDGSWTTTWVEVDASGSVDRYSLWVSGVELTDLTDPFQLIETTPRVQAVDLAADAGGNLHLTWTELAEPSRIATRRFNHRTGWEDELELAAGASTVEVLVLPRNTSRAVFVQDGELTTVSFE